MAGQAPVAGHVRELENIVERAVTLARGPEVTIADLGVEFAASGLGGGTLRPSLAELEADYIRRVLEETRGDKAQAARRTSGCRVGDRPSPSEPPS